MKYGKFDLLYQRSMVKIQFVKNALFQFLHWSPFASFFVLNLVGESDRVAFPQFVLFCLYGSLTHGIHWAPKSSPDTS